MNTTIQENDNQVVAVLEGRLDTGASLQAQKDLQPLLEYKGREIVLDCTSLDYIASSGLRIFLNILQEARKNDSKVVIEGANDYLREVFSMTGFTRLFEIR